MSADAGDSIEGADDVFEMERSPAHPHQSHSHSCAPAPAPGMRPVARRLASSLDPNNVILWDGESYERLQCLCNTLKETFRQKAQ